jgi:hypothetical protein
MPPRQKPGKSKQDYQTPPALLQAVTLLLYGRDIPSGYHGWRWQPHGHDAGVDSTRSNWGLLPHFPSRWCVKNRSNSRARPALVVEWVKAL